MTLNNSLLNKLKLNTIKDLGKDRLSVFERKDILKDIMQSNNISLTKISKLTGIPKSTLHGWLLFDNLSVREYRNLIDSGITKTEIFNSLKKSNDPAKITEYELDLNLMKIDNCVNIIENLKNKVIKKLDLLASIDTLNKFKKINNDTNYIIMKIENYLKDY